MPTTRDYYEVLSVSRDADGNTIKSSYRRLAMKFHPDRNPGDGEAEEKFKECAEAYEVLSDPEKRQRYDQFGHAGLRGTSGHDFNSMNAQDIFSMFDDIFGGVFGGSTRQRGGRGRAQRGYDLETQTEITLEQVLTGTEVTIEFRRMDLCDKCEGTGGKPGTRPTTCVACGGVGQVQQAGLGGMFRMVTTCPKCNGAGQAYPEDCPRCKGKGRVPTPRQVSVKVPAGIQDGQIIRVAGEGEPGMSPDGKAGPRGDLHVVVRIPEHPVFVREAEHLILKMPVSYSQAALGATLRVPTLDGQEREIDLPAGSQHGEMLRLAGQGLPRLRSNGRGDLAVLTLIEVPKKLTSRQKELLRELAGTEDHDVMPETKGFWNRIKEHLGGAA